jgi:ABC-type transport system involved in multi-copper enzyme maturation permease subunit
MQEYQVVQWKYQNDTINYQKTQQQISDITSLFSPMDAYSRLTSGLLNKQKPFDPADMFGGRWYLQQKEITLFESLGYYWSFIVALLVMIAAAFDISYMAFMRTDVA